MQIEIAKTRLSLLLSYYFYDIFFTKYKDVIYKSLLNII